MREIWWAVKTGDENLTFQIRIFRDLGYFMGRTGVGMGYDFFKGG